MFFNKSKRIATELGNAVENSFKSGFVGTKYIDENTQRLKPPYGFYDDFYVRGFVNTEIMILGDIGFGLSSLDPQKKAEIITRSFQYLIGNDAIRIMQDIHQELVKGELGDGEFRRGSNDATTLVFAAYNRLRKDDPDPILQEAKKLAPTMHDTLISMKDEAQTTSSSLAAAVSWLTIGAHIRKRYLE